MINQNIFTLKIGGEAGQGVKSSGNLFARFASRSGYYIFSHVEFPSVIRGGHNVMQINVSAENVTAPSKSKTDFLIALNQDTIHKHADELISGSGILFDQEDDYDTTGVSEGCNLYPIPLSKLAQDAGGKELLINTVALGAAAGLLGGDLEILKNLIVDEYGDKGEEIVEADKKAVELGYNYALEHFTDSLQKILSLKKTTSTMNPKMVLNGNEAVALGSIAAGLQFASIYPMSPISNILHILAAHQEKYGYVYKQPEDEIAAVNMAVGASFAGARAMVATSGGGFCLMSEGYGLSGITETPLVIIEGMRGSPGTGIATWSEQGDLRFVLHAHQGDFPRIVLAPGDAEETFFLTMKAFNLADKYQTPVVILIDKNLCESEQDFPVFDISSYVVDRGKFTTEKVPDYQRYALQSDGISMRSIPGAGNFMVANSDEHDEVGYSTEEIDERNAQMEKRMTKLKTCADEDMEVPQLFGPEQADVTLVSWGSNKGSILQAMKNFNNVEPHAFTPMSSSFAGFRRGAEPCTVRHSSMPLQTWRSGTRVNFLHITWMNPFPTEEVKKILSNARHIISVECNISAQFTGLIREKTGIDIKDKLLKYDGRPIYPVEIENKIRSTKSFS